MEVMKNGRMRKMETDWEEVLSRVSEIIEPKLIQALSYQEEKEGKEIVRERKKEKALDDKERKEAMRAEAKRM